MSSDPHDPPIATPGDPAPCLLCATQTQARLATHAIAYGLEGTVSLPICFACYRRIGHLIADSPDFDRVALLIRDALVTALLERAPTPTRPQ